MTKPLFTKEDAERLAVKRASNYLDGSQQSDIAGNSFLAGIAAAEAEFQKRLEEAPTVVQTEPGRQFGWYEEREHLHHMYKRKAKLFNVTKIGEEA